MTVIDDIRPAIDYVATEVRHPFERGVPPAIADGFSLMLCSLSKELFAAEAEWLASGDRRREVFESIYSAYREWLDAARYLQEHIQEKARLENVERLNESIELVKTAFRNYQSGIEGAKQLSEYFLENPW